MVRFAGLFRYSFLLLLLFTELLAADTDFVAGL